MTPPLGLYPLASQGLDKELRTRQQKALQCAFCFLGVGRLGLFVVAWLIHNSLVMFESKVKSTVLAMGMIADIIIPILRDMLFVILSKGGVKANTRPCNGTQFLVFISGDIPI